MKLSTNDIKNTLIARSKHLIQLAKNNDGISVLDEAEFLINIAGNIKLFYCHDESEGKRCEKQCDYCIGFEGYTDKPNSMETKQDKLLRTTSKDGLINLYKSTRMKNADLLAKVSEQEKEIERLRAENLLLILQDKQASEQSQRIQQLEGLLKRTLEYNFEPRHPDHPVYKLIAEIKADLNL